MKRPLRKAHPARFALPAMALTWAAAAALHAQPPTYTTIPIGNLGTDPNGIATSTADALNPNGQIVGFSEQFNSSHTDLGPEAILYNNGVLTNLGNLGTASDGSADSYATAINASGVIIGNAEAFDSSHNDDGARGFLYQSGTLTSIGVLAVGTDGTGASNTVAINSSGTVIGVSELYDGSGNDDGQRGVVYQSGTLTNIGDLGTDTTGYSYSDTIAINSSGLVVGDSWKYDGSGNYLGNRAVMWQSGTLTELTNIGTNGGVTDTEPVAVNDAGTIIGQAEAWNGTTDLGSRMVFWQSNVVTQVGTLGTDPTGYTSEYSTGINTGGTIVGAAESYSASHVDQGLHGVVYQSGTLTDIGTLGTDPNGIGASTTIAINTGGMVIGSSEDYNSSHVDLGQRAIVFQTGALTNLGTPLTNSSGFGFSTADGLNDAGTVWGHYDAVDSSDDILGPNLAFIWTSGNGFETADQFLAGGAAANGWASINSITGITSSGAIVGIGTRLDGSTEGFTAPLATTLTWDGATNNNWDNATGNWSNSNTNTAVFTAGVVATFDDTAATTATSVNITTTVLPLLANINSNNNNYIFSGAGSISGSAALAKGGNSTLTITNTNSYTGGTYINGGTLTLGNGGATGSLGSGEVIVDGTLNLDLAGTLANGTSGSGSIVQNATTTTTLSGFSSFAGTATISKGAIRLGNTNALQDASIVLNINNGLTFSGSIGSFTTGALSGTGNLTLTDSNNAAVAFTTENNGSSTIYPGILGGLGSLGISGLGTLTLTGANSYAGTTTINGGAIQVGNGGTTGQISTAAVTDNGTLAFDRIDNLTINNTISGTGDLNQLTTGALTLTGQNSFQGSITLFAGTIVVGAGVNTGAGTSPLGAITGSYQGTVEITSGATLNLGTAAGSNNLNFGARQFDIAGTGVNGVGAIVNTGNGQQNAFQDITLAGNATINATGRFDLRNSDPTLGLFGFNLTKIGTGQFTLVGATVTGDGGSIVVQQGTMGIETTTSLLAGDTSLNYWDGTTAEFYQTGTSVTAPFTMGSQSGAAAGSGVTMLQNNNTAIVLGSNILLQDNLTLASGATGSSFTMAGNITDDGAARSVTRIGSVATQTWIFDGADTYSGATFINGATLQLANTNAVQNSTVTMNGGTLQFATGISSFTAGGLAGSGNITLADTGGNAITLTFGGNKASTTYSGVLSGSGAIVKNGTGLTTFSGLNSYTGGTTINAGTLSVTGSLATTGSVTLSNATLSGITGVGNGVGNVTMTSGTLSPGTTGTPIGTLNLASLTVSGGNLQYTLGASNTSDLLAITGAANFTGSPTLTVSAGTVGTYTLLTSSSLSATHPILVAPGGGGVIYTLDYHIANDILLDVTVPIVENLVWDGQNDLTTWDMVKTNWNNQGNTASTYADGDTVTFDDTAPTNATSIALNVSVAPTSVTINSNTHNYTFTGAGSIYGTTPLTKSGTSTLILATTNSYSGTTTLNAGILQVGNGGTTGSLGTGNVIDNTTLNFNRSDNALVVPGAISGTGAINQNATGTTALSGVNNWSGATTINAGTLQIGNGGTTGSLGSANVTDHGTLAFDRSDSISIATVVSGTGNLAQAGPGTTTLTSAQSYVNTLVDGGGTLATSGSGTLGSGSVTFGADGTGGDGLSLAGNQTVTALTVSSNSATTDTLTIAAGKTFTVSGASTIGLASTAAATTTSLTATGGTLTLNNSLTIGVANTTTTTLNTATLNLTGLSAFNLTAASGSLNASTAQQANSNLLLSNTSNNINVATFNIGNITTVGAYVTANLTLGANTNVVDATTVNIGNGTNATVGFAGTTGSVTIAGLNGGTGASGANITIGGGTSNTNSNAVMSVNVNLAGHAANIDANVVNIGFMSNTNYNPGNMNASLTFDTGAFNMQSLLLGQDNNSHGVTHSTLTIGGGNFNVLSTAGGVYLGKNAENDGNVHAQSITINGGTVNFNTPIVVSTEQGTGNYSNSLSLQGGSLNMNGFAIDASGNNSTNNHPIAINTITMPAAGHTFTLLNLGSNGSSLFANDISVVTNGINGTGVTMSGAGTLILDGNNTYTAATTVAPGGTIQIGSGGATGTISSSSSVSDSGVLAFDHGDAGFTFSNGISGTGAVNQIGTGTTTLSGISNYSGGTNVNAGALSVTGSLASSGVVSILGGTLAGITTAGNSVGKVTLSSGAISPGTTATPIGTLNLASLTVSGGALQFSLGASNTSDLLSVSGAASFTASSTLLLSSAVMGSFLLLTSTSLSGTHPTVSGPAGFGYTELFNQPSDPNDIVLIVGPSNLTWDGQNDGITWDISNHQNWNNGSVGNAVYTDHSNVTFDDTNTNGTAITLTANVLPASVTVNSNLNNYSFNGTGSIGGTTSLVKSGASGLMITTNNTYSGGTVINNGVLQVGNGGTTGSLGYSATNGIADNGMLIYNRGNAITESNNITGTGSLSQSGPGTTTLMGSNNYTGGATIQAGTLAIGAAGALPSGGNVANASTLAINATSTAGNVSGTTGTTQVASGISFTAANFTQMTVVDQGSLTITGSGTIGSPTTPGITGGGSLTLGNGSTTNTLTLATNSGLSEVGSLSILGSASLDVNNNHLYITYGTNPDPVSTIRQYLTNGYNKGISAWAGGSGNPALISTPAAPTQTTNTVYALGYADSADSGIHPAGLPVNTIEVKYTLVGDLNLDGAVSGADFTQLSNDFGHFDAQWDEGDLQYNGVVNGADFSALSFNFGKLDSGASIPLSAADWAAFDSFAATQSGLQAAVPEPTTGGIFLLIGAGLTARRRKKAKISQ